MQIELPDLLINPVVIPPLTLLDPRIMTVKQ